MRFPNLWAKLVLCFFLGAISVPSHGSAKAEALGTTRDNVEWTVRVTPNAAYETSAQIKDRSMRKELDQVLKTAAEAPPSALIPVRLELQDTFVAWEGSKTAGGYAVDEDGSLVDVSRAVKLPTSEQARVKLLAQRNLLRSRHYGMLIPWDDADTVLPRKAVFEVTDIETGLMFRAQRRAGSSHADMQPITKADSASMKQAFGGKWSWNRRAVLLRYEDRLYAASMNGMPHGGDGIPDNGFKGHFCIHFLGSTTHGKRNLDLAHQVMVHKAAGQLGPFLRSLNPYQLADLFVIGINQEDELLLKATRQIGAEPLPDEWQNIKKIRRSAALPEFVQSENEMEVNFSMNVTVYDDNSKGRRRTLNFQIVKEASGSGWSIRNVSM